MTIKDIIDKINDLEESAQGKGIEYHEAINDIVRMLYKLEEQEVCVLSETRTLADIFLNHHINVYDLLMYILATAEEE